MYRLRELERADMPVLNEWRNKPELIQYLVAPFRYVNTSVDGAWFDHYMETRNSNVRCAIIREENDELVGCVYLLNIDWISRKADFGIMIGKQEDRSRGAGSFAVRAMLDHAFLNMGLHRIELIALESNERAISLYKKCGFQTEGVLRDYLFKHGRYVNAVSMAVLSDDYLKCKE